jgi:hypothetical protein
LFASTTAFVSAVKHGVSLFMLLLEQSHTSVAAVMIVGGLLSEHSFSATAAVMAVTISKPVPVAQLSESLSL